MSINNWLNGAEIPKIDAMIDGKHRLLEKAFKEQHEIGWEHFIRGRFTITWGELYNATVDRTRLENQKADAEKWSKEIILLTWRMILDMWYERNTAEHGTPDNEKAIEKQKLIDKIIWVYHKKKKYEKEYKKIMKKTILEKMPISNLLMISERLRTVNEDFPMGSQGESQFITTECSTTT